jgi:hypothetical protein
MNSYIKDFKAAARRAKHFATPFDGPHSSLYSPLGNNYARMVYAAPPNTLCELLMLHGFAEALNSAADERRVADDLELREAFASFLSLLWLDPERLP